MVVLGFGGSVWSNGGGFEGKKLRDEKKRGCCFFEGGVLFSSSVGAFELADGLSRERVCVFWWVFIIGLGLCGVAMGALSLWFILQDRASLERVF